MLQGREELETARPAGKGATWALNTETASRTASKEADQGCGSTFVEQKSKLRKETVYLLPGTWAGIGPAEATWKRQHRVTDEKEQGRWATEQGTSEQPA